MASNTDLSQIEICPHVEAYMANHNSLSQTWLREHMKSCQYCRQVQQTLAKALKVDHIVSNNPR